MKEKEGMEMLTERRVRKILSNDQTSPFAMKEKDSAVQRLQRVQSGTAFTKKTEDSFAEATIG